MRHPRNLEPRNQGDVAMVVTFDEALSELAPHRAITNCSSRAFSKDHSPRKHKGERGIGLSAKIAGGGRTLSS